jgi:ADP-ribose pyrophosphatase YjhB (NUDIX family)
MSHERPARPVLGAAAVVIHDGRVVLIRRAKAPSAGEWSIPGGAVELGESVEEALRREVREETGLEIVVGRFLEVFERRRHAPRRRRRVRGGARRSRRSRPLRPRRQHPARHFRRQAK